MKGKKIALSGLICLLTISCLSNGFVDTVKANEEVYTSISEHMIQIGNDAIARTYSIDDQLHMVTSIIENKRIQESIHPASGSSDFYLNTINTSQEEADQAILPIKQLTRDSWSGSVSSADGTTVTTNLQPLLDGNEATEIDFSAGKKFPYHLQIDLGSAQTIRSFSYQKRAGNANKAWGINGTIGKYALYVSEDGTTWSPAGDGEFTNEDYRLHEVNQNGTTIYNVGERVYGNFDKAYTTRYIRLDMLSGALSEDISFTGSDFCLYEDGYQPPVNDETVIESSQLTFMNAQVSDSDSGNGKKITMTFEPYTLNEIDWHFKYITVIEPNEHFMRSYVEASSDQEKLATIDFIELDHFLFDDSLTDVWSHPDYNVNDSAYSFPGYEFMLGQPIYANGMFFGSEFPATDTAIQNNTMQIRYYSGKSLSQMRDEHLLTTDGKFVTWPNVVGAATGTRKDVVQTDFFAYIDTIATQTDFRKQYNSWYDNRMAITDDSISKTFFATEKGLSNHGVEPLDSYVVDDGWNNYNDPEFTGIDEARSGSTYNRSGFWEFNDKFPNELYPANDMANKFASSFGLWLGPQGGYELQGSFSQYIGKSGTGYVHPTAALGNVICTGSKVYIDNLTNLFVDYQKRFDIDYWKLDGFASRPCTQSGHDHMTGGYHNMYFTSEFWEHWTDAFEAMRKQRVDEQKGLFINATSYVNPSPWMLRWVNTVWLQNAGDLATAGTGSSSARMITGRDVIYFNNYKTAQLQFPLKNVYNHDPIYGVSAGVNMDTTGFRDYMMSNAVRGTAFWELYFSPDMVDEAKWQVSADVLAWAKDNAHILEKAKLFGTSATADVYGYSSWHNNEGIVSFRNPTASIKTYTLTLDNTVGVPTDMRNLTQTQILPYKNTQDSETVSYGSTLVVTLKPYETRIYQYGIKDVSAPIINRIKITDDHTIRITFNERISDQLTFEHPDINFKTKLMDDYKTVELTADKDISDNLTLAITAQDIIGNQLKESITLSYYKDGVIAQAIRSSDLFYGSNIQEETYDVDQSNFMNIHGPYMLKDKGLSGKNDVSASITFKTTHCDVNLLNQEQAFSIGIDKEGFINATLGSQSLSSKEITTLVKEKASGRYGTDDYQPTTTREHVKGRVDDGRLHTVNLIREVNGMLKLYLDGKLCNTVYQKQNLNEELTSSAITLGDTILKAKVANIRLLNYALGYDEIEADYQMLIPKRYQMIDRSDWQATASSEYKGANEGPAKFAIDGNAGTLWHTNWAQTYPEPIDHWIAFDFGKAETFTRFEYTARAKGTNGNIKDFLLQIKNEHGEWEDYTQGTFEDGGTTNIDFESVTTNAIRLKRVSSYGVQPTHAAAVEINLYNDQGEQADLDALLAYIQAMDDLKIKDDYTTASYTAYEMAYYALTALADELNLTKIKIDQAIDNYETSLAKLVDIKALNSACAAAQHMIENKDKYTSAYINQLKAAHEEAKAIAAANATQAQVDAATDKLNELVNNPILREDTTMVKAMLFSTISKAQSAIDSGQVETLAPAVKALFNRYLAAARDVYDNKDATNQDVLKAWQNLAEIMQYLDFQADKTALNKLITECELINTEDYTQGVEEFNNALANAQQVSADDKALQKRIDEAYSRLFSAKEGLKQDIVDKSVLKMFIDLANKAKEQADRYNPDSSWNEMLEALDQAHSVYDNKKATRADVEAAAFKLAQAYENIRLLPDEKLLEQLRNYLEAVEGINKKNYTASAYNYMMETAAKARELLNSKDYTQAQADEMLNSIVKAYDLMDSGKVEQPTGTGTTNSNIKPSAKPDTSDASNTAGLLFILGIAGISTIITRRKSKS